MLTDLVFIDQGRVALAGSLEELAARFLEVRVHPGQEAAARALLPLHERRHFGRSILLFDGGDRGRLAPLGELRTPGIGELFVALLGRPVRGEAS